MSTFANTVEKLGDAALTDSIINRTVTEYKDNIATRVGKCAFRRCLLLAIVDMPNITYIDENAFNECSALNTLILRRTDSIVTLSNANALANTPIANGTGYIYVPSALVDAYKADTEWNVYASQIRAIEDYPYVCDLYTWDSVFYHIEQGDYASLYSIGDAVPLDLGAEGLVNMKIVAFDTDELADGSGKAPITWISSDALATKHRMNPALVTNADGTYQEGTGAIGGWEKCEMRTYLNDTVKPLIPEAVRSNIKEVNKYSVSFATDGTKNRQASSVDSIWLPSFYEVNASTSTNRETKGVVYANNISFRSTVFPILTALAFARTGSSTRNYLSVNSGGSSGYSAEGTLPVWFGFCT